MERLTRPIKADAWIHNGNAEWYKKVYLKLQEYENTDKEPSEVVALIAENEELKLEVEKYRGRFYDADNLYNSIPVCLSHDNKCPAYKETAALKIVNSDLEKSIAKTKEIAKEWVDECESRNKEIKEKDKQRAALDRALNNALADKAISYKKADINGNIICQCECFGSDEKEECIQCMCEHQIKQAERELKEQENE